MRLGLVSDIHWMAEPPATACGWHGAGADLAGALDALALALEHFAERRVDAVVVAGDLTHHGDLGSLAAVLTACTRASAPVLVVAGNHDVDGGADQLACAHALAEAPGVALASGAGVSCAGVRVAGVHVGELAGWFGARLQRLPDAAAWSGEPVVLISHYPVLSLAERVSEQGFPYPGDLLDRRELAGLLMERSAPTLAIGGHVHARATLADGPLLQLTGGALVEPPYECAVIDVEVGTSGSLAVRRECLRLREPDGGREPVLAPEREAWLFDGWQWRTTTDRGEDDEAQHRQDPHDAHGQPAAA
jgi:calcineurin-like phosphoesterase family protein